MVATPEKPNTDKPAYKVVGTRPVRPDGVDKVTGRAEYGADIKLEGMLYGAVLRSPHAHARIKRIDTSKAEALPGVKAVATHADFPKQESGSLDLGEGSANPLWLVENVLAGSKVLYHGHAVAAVAATDLHIAEDALALIEVEYEVLPFVIDVREAMLPNAPILLDDLRTNVRAKGVDTPKDVPTNIALHMRLEKGDIEQGFADADVVIEREYTTAQAHQGYIEPQNGTAFWNRDGQLTIWCSTQGIFSVRSQCATLLGLPQQALAELLGVSRPTVSRMGLGSYRLSRAQPKSWELGTLFVRMFRSLDALLGHEEAARAWLQGPNSDLGGRPAELILSAEGLVRVVHYLDAHRGRL